MRVADTGEVAADVAVVDDLSAVLDLGVPVLLMGQTSIACDVYVYWWAMRTQTHLSPEP